jgi:hypothetical protein
VEKFLRLSKILENKGNQEEKETYKEVYKQMKIMIFDFSITC